MYVNHLYVCIISMVLSSAVFAEVSPSVHESVLPPGAILVAGDPDKNEFFIVGKDEIPTFARTAVKTKATPTLKKIPYQEATPKAANKNLTPRVKAALNKTLLKTASNKPRSQKKMVLNKPQGKKKLVIKTVKIVNKQLVLQTYKATKKVMPERHKALTKPSKQVTMKKATLLKSTATKKVALRMQKASNKKQQKVASKKRLTKTATVTKKKSSHVALLNREKHKPKGLVIYKV